MRDASARVLDVESDQAEFRAHDLNLPGVASGELVVSLDAWRRCEVVDLPPRTGPVFVGLDLGAHKSFTSAAMFWPESNRMEIMTACPDQPSLAARARDDAAGGVYERARAAGDLTLMAGRLTPLGPFLRAVRARLATEPVAAVGCDRYRSVELRQHLDDLGLRWRPVWRGYGAKASEDAARDIRSFQTAVEGGTLKTKPNVLMVYALGEAHIQRDASGHATALRKAPGPCLGRTTESESTLTTRPARRVVPFNLRCFARFPSSRTTVRRFESMPSYRIRPPPETLRL